MALYSLDGLLVFFLGVFTVGMSGCSSPSSKLDFMWYFLAGVLGDVELALDSLGEEAMETLLLLEATEAPSEKTDSAEEPPPGGFSTRLNCLTSAGVAAGITSAVLMWLIPPGGWIRVVLQQR